MPLPGQAIHTGQLEAFVLTGSDRGVRVDRSWLRDPVTATEFQKVQAGSGIRRIAAYLHP